MAISPFSARPGSPENEGRRARIVLALVTLGIAASLLAYAVSPSVRHAVGHAAHSVKHAVGRVFDHDTAHKRAATSHQHRVVVHVHAPTHAAQGAKAGHTPHSTPATSAPHTTTTPG